MRFIFLSFLTFLLFYSQKICAQKTDTTFARIYCQKADFFFYELYLDSALVYYTKASDVYEKEQLWEEYIRSTNQIVQVLFYRYDLKKIERYLNRNLALSQKLRSVSHETLAQCYFLLGKLSYGKSNYNHALQCFEKSLSRWNISTQKDQHTIGDLYLYIGRIWIYKKDYDKAMLYCQKAISIAKKYNDKVHWATGLNCIGVIHAEQNNYSEALFFYQKSLAIRSSIYTNENHLTFTQSYTNLANIFIVLKQYDKAIEYIQKSIKIIHKVEGKEYYSLSYRYYSLGDIYFELKDYKEAIRYYHQALTIPQDSALEYIKVYLRLAKVYDEENNLSQALFYAQQAINTAVSNTVEAPKNYSNPSLDEVFSGYQLFSGLHFKAKILEKKYNHDTTNLQALELAFQTYFLANKLTDQLRFDHDTEKAIQDLSTLATTTYEGAIRTAFHLYEITQQKKYLKQAFQCIEKSKSFLFLRHLQNIQIRHFSTIPDSLLQLEKDLKTKIVQLEVSPSKNSPSVAEKLFEKKRSLEALMKKFEMGYPQYFHSKYNLETVDLPQVQQALPDHQSAVIEYFYGEKNIYAFTITKRTYWLTTIQLDNNLQQYIDDFHQQLVATEIDFKQYTTAAYQLYQQLLFAVLAKGKEHGPTEAITKLIIIPDGELHYLPFEAFLTKKIQNNEAVNYLKLPYLLYDQQLSYANSATLLFGNAWQHKQATSKKCLAFAYGIQDEVPLNTNPYNLRSGNFSNLPGTLQEMYSLNQFFEVDIYQGPNALEQYFKQKASDYSIIHLGLHGQMDSTNALLSKLHFRNPKTDTLEDGFLHIYEIYNQQLNADLAVLSSCEAGVGKLVSSEGVLSISRAFQYAGCPSVVTTLWAIPDGPTAAIVGNFYHGLKKGWTKDKALRMAKLNYLQTVNDPAKSAPSFWAGLILVGDAMPLPQEPNFSLLSMLSCIAVSMLGIYLLYSRLYKTSFASLAL